jgi:sulfatase maturation enzyme AslB (radical SAM superfamily)
MIFLVEKYTNTNNIILTLTRKCQFSCRYCKMSRNKADISKKNIHKAIDFLFTSEEKELTIQFFGGEPMLRFDLIKEAIGYADKKNFDKNKKTEYLITTNGLLLDQKKLDFIAERGITLMFSLDGAKKTNNKNRVISDAHHDHYEQIMKNIKKAHNRHCRYFINMAVDSDEADSLAKNYFALLDAGLRDIHITYVLGKIWPIKKQEEFIGNLIKIKTEQGRKYPDYPSFSYDYASEPFFSSPVIMVDGTEK